MSESLDELYCPSVSQYISEIVKIICAQCVCVSWVFNDKEKPLFKPVGKVTALAG
jgi:hypothetical protein